MSQTSTERLRDYLAQLPPQSQALLMREFERAIERGEDVAVANFVLEQLRKVVRGSEEDDEARPRTDDPARLHAIRAQCDSGEHDGAFCAQVAQADLKRFLSGHTGPDEYRTLADLPAIPASFDTSTTSQDERP